ncbi:MAG: hypothetical protein WC756_10500 [Taibaiella sp.]|jgi:hypothetical protein
MHTLIRYLLDNEKVSLNELIEHSEDNVISKDPANIFQLCFIKLAEAIEKKEFEPASNSTDVLRRLLTLLLKTQTEFTDPTHIATIFNTLGKIAFSNENNVHFIRITWPVFEHFLLTFSKTQILEDKTIATLLEGLGRLKDNDAIPDLGEKQRILQAQALALIQSLCESKPSAQATTMAISGLSRLRMSDLSDKNKEQLDALLSTSIQAFMGLEKSAWGESFKPNAQEISNILYAIAKLSKQGALISSAWQTQERQTIIHELIKLTFKKQPSQHAISQIFYSLGKLAERQCLVPHNDLYWLMSSLIKYLIHTLSPIDHRTAITIFTALGRLAERNFLVKDDWQQDNAALLDKLLKINFTNPHDIADLYLSLGRLAEKDILTLELWDKHKNKILALIDTFKQGPAKEIYKNAFYKGLNKLHLKGFIDQKQNDNTNSFNRSPSVSPILDQLRLTYEDEKPGPSQPTSDKNDSTLTQTPTKK